MKVLLLENATSDITKILNIFDTLGWELLGNARNIGEVKTYLENNPPDLIVANTFGDNGYITQTILRDISLQDIPVLVFTVNYGKELQDTDLEKSPKYLQVLSNLFRSLSDTSEELAKPLKSTGIEVFGKQQEKIVIPLDQILWIDVERNYCFLKTENSRYGLKTSLSKLMESLDERFIRVHRRYVVNSDAITLVKLSRKQVFVNQTLLPIGRLYKTDVLKYLSERAN